MRFKTKDIGESGVGVDLPVTGEWLAAECPNLEIRPGDAGIRLQGRLERSGDSYLLRGALRGALITPCARCLEPAVIPLDQPVTVSYVEADDEAESPEGAEEDGGDVLTFSGGVIDVGPEIRDEILLAVPIGPTCQPECAGICSVCGGNRNQKPCDCEEQQRRASSKFSALKDLKV
jgi:uncharacterized protein